MDSPLNVGVLTISLDTELGWGGYGSEVDLGLSHDGLAERESIQSLLEIFETYNTPVTWAIVGHMFLKECDGTHSDLITASNPEYSRNWYKNHEPLKSLRDNPLLYGNDVVESILASDLEHEVATHTFTHVLCDENGCSPEMLEKELEKSKELGKKYGKEITTLVFPRNNIAYLRSVRKSGISVFRGHSPEKSRRNRSRLGHARVYAKSFTRERVPTVLPQQVLNGLWMLPASLQLEYHPKLSDLQQKLFSHPRVERIKSGLDYALKQNKVVHLWGHPHGMTESILADLKKVLRYAESIGIEVRTVQDTVALCSKASINLSENYLDSQKAKNNSNGTRLCTFKLGRAVDGDNG